MVRGQDGRSEVRSVDRMEGARYEVWTGWKERDMKFFVLLSLPSQNLFNCPGFIRFPHRMPSAVHVPPSRVIVYPGRGEVSHQVSLGGCTPASKQVQRNSSARGALYVLRGWGVGCHVSLGGCTPPSCKGGIILGEGVGSQVGGCFLNHRFFVACSPF